MARPGLTRHRKFARLSRLIGSEVLARGHLEMLWDVAYENGDDVLGDAGDVEFLAKWAGEPGKLAGALHESGFLDVEEGSYRVHDLWDHAPEYVAHRREKEKERRKGKECAHCGAEYKSPDSRSKYCTDACRKAAWRDGKETDEDGGFRRNPSHETDCDDSPAPAPAPAPALEAASGAVAPLRAPQKAKPTDLVEALRGAWNAKKPPNCPSWESTPKKRRKAAEALLEAHRGDLQPLAWWDQVLDGISRSAFLRGEKGGGFRATPDWALQPDSIAKISERAYEDAPRIVRHGPEPAAAPPPDPPEPIPDDLEPVPRQLVHEAFQEAAEGYQYAIELLGKVQVAGRQGDRAILVAEDKFTRDFVGEHWGAALEKAFASRGVEGGIRWFCAPQVAPPAPVEQAQGAGA